MDPAGNRAVLGVSTDITEIKRLQSTEQQEKIFTEAMLDISTTLNRTLDLNVVLDQIMEQLYRVVKNDAVVVYLFENQLVHAVRWQGWDIDEINDYLLSSFPISSVPNLELLAQNRYPLVVETSDSSKRRSQTYAPIIIKDEVIGFLEADSNTPHFYTHEDANRLSAFANQAAIAIENARLFEVSHRRAVEAETLHEASSIVTASLMDENETFNKILEQLNRVVPYDSATVQ